MSASDKPIAVRALDVPPRAQASSYPEPFAARMAGRQKRALGDYFGLANFGVNLTRLLDDLRDALQDRPRWIVGAGRQLVVAVLAAIDIGQHDIGERAAGIDTDPESAHRQ